MSAPKATSSDKHLSWLEGPADNPDPSFYGMSASARAAQVAERDAAVAAGARWYPLPEGRAEDSQPMYWRPPAASDEGRAR